MGLLGLKFFLFVPCFLNFLEFLSSKGQVQTVANQGGYAETREEQWRNNCATLGQGPGSPSRDFYIILETEISCFKIPFISKVMKSKT